ncbi:F-box/LRR-repeat protein [Trifolium pratense]|uniref:F-box/LRR-repeat protein n=1 Tax=Trifolium pratense TaxID=57577 RepID=A0A2K3PNK4_TRIPR|nr:F-box/LRR-repeat protein [Trifolium pratense]
MKRQRTTRNSSYLPDDCWESICTFLVDGDYYNHHYLEPLSLTSKYFLSITNRLRSSFTISDPTLLFIPILFHRFPNLTSLHITSFEGDLNALLCQISKFPFKLKSLKLSDCSTFPTEGLRALSRKITTLISLTCSNIADLSNNHCVLISDCFPLLEELHLQHNATYSTRIQVGVETKLIALPKLRKIILSDHAFYNINNNSLLLHLCKNCEFLEEVVM